MFKSEFLLAVVLLTSNSVLSATYEEVLAACNKEHKFKDDLRAINYDDPDYPQEGKCALACIFEKKGVFKPDGSIDKAKEKELIEETIQSVELKRRFLKAIEECDQQAKGNKCDTAFEFIKCKRSKAEVN